MAVGTRPEALQVGFWRKGTRECDLVVITPGAMSEYIESKSSGKQAMGGIRAAVDDLKHPGIGYVLTGAGTGKVERLFETQDPNDLLKLGMRLPTALWLYNQNVAHGGTLRIRV